MCLPLSYNFTLPVVFSYNLKSTPCCQQGMPDPILLIDNHIADIILHIQQSVLYNHPVCNKSKTMIVSTSQSVVRQMYTHSPSCIV